MLYFPSFLKNQRLALKDITPGEGNRTPQKDIFNSTPPSAKTAIPFTPLSNLPETQGNCITPGSLRVKHSFFYTQRGVLKEISKKPDRLRLFSDHHDHAVENERGNQDQRMDFRN